MQMFQKVNRIFTLTKIISTPSQITVRKMSIDIGGMRKPYRAKQDTFDVKDLVAKEPFAQFTNWFDEAKKHASIEEPNAMCLATSTSDGFPSARMVLLKSFGPPSGILLHYILYK